MLSVTAPLERWSGGSWHFITVAGPQADEIRAHCLAVRRGFGSARVEATIAGLTWRTSVFPMKAGGYFLPVKAQVRRGAEIGAGDLVAVSLELL